MIKINKTVRYGLEVKTIGLPAIIPIKIDAPDNIEIDITTGEELHDEIVIKARVKG